MIIISPARHPNGSDHTLSVIIPVGFLIRNWYMNTEDTGCCWAYGRRSWLPCKRDRKHCISRHTQYNERGVSMPQQRHFVVFRLRWRHNEKWPTKPSKAWNCCKSGNSPNTSTGNAAISKDQLLLIKRYRQVRQNKKGAVCSRNCSRVNPPHS